MRVVETVPTHLTAPYGHHQQHQQNTNLTSLQNSPQSTQQHQHGQPKVQQPSVDTTLTTTIGPFSPPELPSGFRFYSFVIYDEK